MIPVIVNILCLGTSLLQSLLFPTSDSLVEPWVVKFCIHSIWRCLCPANKMTFSCTTIESIGKVQRNPSCKFLRSRSLYAKFSKFCSPPCLKLNVDKTTAAEDWRLRKSATDPVLFSVGDHLLSNMVTNGLLSIFTIGPFGPITTLWFWGTPWNCLSIKVSEGLLFEQPLIYRYGSVRPRNVKGCTFLTSSSLWRCGAQSRASKERCYI